MRLSLRVALSGLIIACASTSVASGQTLGVQMGIASSTESRPMNTSKLTAQTGTMLGAFIRFPLGPVQMETGASYLGKGFEEKHEGPDPNVPLDINEKVGYLEVPLLAIITMWHSAVSPFFMVGPELGIRLSCSRGLAEGGGSRSDCKDEFKSTDIGVTAGAGLEISVGPGQVLLQGRYTRGLMDVAASKAATGSIRNRGTALTAGYSITLH